VDKAVGYFNSKALLNANHRYRTGERFNPSEGKQIYAAAKKELDEVGKYAKSPEQMQQYQRAAKLLEDSANKGMTAYLLEAKSVLTQAREMVAEGDKKLDWKSQHPAESRGQIRTHGRSRLPVRETFHGAGRSGHRPSKDLFRIRKRAASIRRTGKDGRRAESGAGEREAVT